MQTTNSKCNSHPKTFNVRYEDDTEKANDKKAAQLRNKVKRNYAGAQMIKLAFYGFAGSGEIISLFAGAWSVETTAELSEWSRHHL